MNLKIKITLENKRLLRLRGVATSRIWCVVCKAETEFAAEKDFADLLVEDKKPHKIIAADGTFLICLESISKS